MTSVSGNSLNNQFFYETVLFVRPLLPAVLQKSYSIKAVSNILCDNDTCGLDKWHKIG